MVTKLLLEKSKLKWHQLYYLLAIIDILTILAALSLTQLLMDTYESSVEENQRMSNSVSEFIKLGFIAQNVNEPGNRIFESKNIREETLALEQNQIWFNTAFEHASKNLLNTFSEKDISLISENLLHLEKSMGLMVAESYLIFKAVEDNDLVRAGKHMAIMDGYYYQVTQAIGDISQVVADIQNRQFAQQLLKAKSIKRYELAISFVVLFIITFVTVYGHQLGKKIQEKDIKIKRSAKQAQQSAKAKSQFLANMSHEIRTPMNAIMGMLNLIKRDDLSKENQQFLTLAQCSADNLLVIINDILDFSKSESEHLILERLPFNLPKLLSQEIKLYQLTNQNDAITLHLDLSKVNEPDVIGDPSRLVQVIKNLLNNAYKFTRYGEITLSAATKRDQDNVIVTIDVKDTGIGIAHDKLATIFEQFSQADTSTTRQYGGTGLGLAISKKICQLMQGDLTVQSAVNEGSCFTITIQLKVSELKVNENARQGNDVLTNVDSLNLHLLVAEDNRINQVLIKKLLDNIGCTYDIANNGQEALEMVNQSHHAILMDCSMPVLDGFEATRKIRALSCELSNLPIIAVTANIMPEDQQRCADAGMTGYISKPIEPAILYQTLSSLSG